MEATDASAAFRVFVSNEGETYHGDGRHRDGDPAAERAASTVDDAATITFIRHNIIGDTDAIPTPMGPRMITYADHTASGRALRFIEDFIAENVLPVYANTHTSTSECGWQSHMFLAEAREIVRDTLGASERDDVVLFTGRGATAASNMLAHFLSGALIDAPGSSVHRCRFPGCGRSFSTSTDLHMHARTHPDGEQSAWLHAPLGAPQRGGDAPAATPSARGTSNCRVIVGPYAHHSSILPWRERGAAVRLLPTPCAGHVDFDALYDALEEECTAAAAEAARVICVFTAASNVTGCLVDVDVITAFCKFFNALCFWDFAAAAPHVPVEMSSKTVYSWSQLASQTGLTRSKPAWTSDDAFNCTKDAVYFSGHKFPGGPSTPGILAMKRTLFTSAAPHLPGGGTVFFVHDDGTPRYLSNDSEREEGGSPDLVGAVRCGLALHVARNVGMAHIWDREVAMATAARARWSRHPCIKVLHPPRASVPIVALHVLAPPGPREALPGGGPSSDAATGRLLHWGFVTAVLNDFFGIQCRGGCLCAGPYAMSLLGLDAATARELEGRLLHKDELLRPGVVRISFAYYMSHPAFQFILNAVEWVADHAHRLLHVYSPVQDTGEWRVNRALVAAHVLDGYRYQARCLRGDAALQLGESGAATQLAAWARSMPVSVGAAGQTPTEFIASVTEGDGAGHVQQAQKGGTRTHPRRWLQDMRLEGGKVHWPAFRVRVHLNPPSGQERPEGGPSTEATLFEAYLQEANTFLLGLLSRAIPAAPHHHPGSVLSPEGQALRWFATAWDYEGPQSGGSPVITWLVTATAQGEVVPPTDNAFFLLAEKRCLDAAEQLLWDGAVSPAPRASAEPSMVERRRPERTERTPAQRSAATTLPKAATTVVQPVPTKPVDVTPSGPSAAAELQHAHKRGSRKATMTEEQYRARARRFEAVKTALSLLPAPPHALCENMKKAVIKGTQDFSMIKDGDRLLVGLSGGKDSLSLLILLLMLQERSPVSYELAACTVDPMYAGFDPSPLKDFLKKLGIPYYYASEPVIDLAATHMDNDSICAWCSRMKRGILYTTARRFGYNVLVLGQHLDDFAESFVMSAFRNGVMRTMKAHYTNDSGDIRIIRPLVYVRERQTREFATAMRLPIINENCPACYTGPTERYHVKKLLAAEESKNAILFNSLCTAMKVLMTDEGAHVVRNMELVVEEAAAQHRLAQRVGMFPGVGSVIRDFIGATHPALENAAGKDCKVGSDDDKDDGGCTKVAERFVLRKDDAFVVNLTDDGPAELPPKPSEPEGLPRTADPEVAALDLFGDDTW